jgi:hypothetical protein
MVDRLHHRYRHRQLHHALHRKSFIATETRSAGAVLDANSQTSIRAARQRLEFAL